VSRVVAIHQPNFLPWLGYYDKLARADVFVLLDSVQFPRSGHGEWMNRVRALGHGEPRWVTVPIRRPGVQLIRDVEIDDSQAWRRKTLRTLEASYRAAPYFSDVFPLVEHVLEHDAGGLANFNEHGVRAVAEELRLERAEMVRSSTLDVEGTGSDLLAEITRIVGGTVYLSGGGAEAYQHEESYRRRGVELRFQNFEQPRYPQMRDDFVPGLSVVDALMYCGTEGVRLQLERST
jgi:hypothetical protein